MLIRKPALTFPKGGKSARLCARKTKKNEDRQGKELYKQVFHF